MRQSPVKPGDHFARRHAPRRLFRVERIDLRDGIPHARLLELGSTDTITIAADALLRGDWLRRLPPEHEAA